MAIIKFIKDKEEQILTELGFQYNGLRLCELGNQSFGERPAKLMYGLLGAYHVSIDINGRDGAFPFNLSEELPEYMGGHFNVITNYSTTEHVSSQIEVFKNIHNLCRVGGIMIHGVPLINNWAGHGRYYYTLEFFNKLANFNGYKIYVLEILDKDFYAAPKNLVYSVLIKEVNNDFKGFDFKDIFDSGNVSRTQNYAKR